MPQKPPLIGEVDNYLKWEWENGLRYVELPEFVPPAYPVKISEPAEAHPTPKISASASAVEKSVVPQETAESPIKAALGGLADTLPPKVERAKLPKLNLPQLDALGADTVGPLSAETVEARAKAMAKLRHEWAACRRCVLAEKRHNFVFGEGNFAPRLLFIGEGPGENEDLQGRPFVGRAGELLTNLIKAMGLRREAVFITNIVKCRPPNNRDPAPEEVVACSELLKKQISILKPEVIVALGKPATHMLLNTTLPISKLRGTWQKYENIPLMPTFHPAYLLRNPKDKGLIWADMCAVLDKLALPVPDITRRKR